MELQGEGSQKMRNNYDYGMLGIARLINRISKTNPHQCYIDE